MPNPHRLPNRLPRPSETTMPTSTNVYQCWWAGVGLTGFEPATLCSQSRCATKLRHSPSCRHGNQG
jgi:hypothetical protein